MSKIELSIASRFTPDNIYDKIYNGCDIDYYDGEYHFGDMTAEDIAEYLMEDGENDGVYEILLDYITENEVDVDNAIYEAQQMAIEYAEEAEEAYHEKWATYRHLQGF